MSANNTRAPVPANRLIAMIIISVVGLAFAIVHLTTTLAIDTTTIVLLVIAAIPWLSVFLSEATLPGGWKLTFIQQKQEEQAKQIATLQFLVTHLLTSGQIGHLRRLDNMPPYIMEKGYAPELAPDLRHLRGLGFIEQTSKTTVNDFINEVEKNGKADASRYFQTTSIGRKYLELRSQNV